MPPAPRPRVVGGIYHVTSRGVRKSDIYRDELDRQCFLDLLAEVTQRTSWLCHAYCLMSNHYHLLVRALRPDISRAMFLLNSRYARRFNERHGLEGHVFERRFAAELIEDEQHVFNTMRYIELNPVRAGICARRPTGRGAATAPPRASSRHLGSSRRSGSFGTSAARTEGRWPTARSSRMGWHATERRRKPAR